MYSLLLKNRIVTPSFKMTQLWSSLIQTFSSSNNPCFLVCILLATDPKIWALILWRIFFQDLRRPIRIQLFLLLVFALLLYKTQKSWKRWFQEVYISLLTFTAASSLNLQPGCWMAILSLWLVNEIVFGERKAVRRSEILDKPLALPVSLLYCGCCFHFCLANCLQL